MRRKALEESTFEDVARAAIGFGNNTDTAAAVAGWLARVRCGIDGIPKRWMMQLPGVYLFERFISESATGKPHKVRTDSLGIDENGRPDIIGYK